MILSNTKYQEGVWWNDNEEKVSGSTHIRGKLSDDVLFQEAEKMGFDVRNSTGLSIFKAGTEAAAPAPEKTVMFNFFGEPDPVEEKPKVIETSMNTLDRKRKAVVLETKPEEKDIDLVMEDIIALAKRFVRERYVIIYAEWGDIVLIINITLSVGHQRKLKTNGNLTKKN